MYAGVGEAFVLGGRPLRGLDLALMDMRAGETRCLALSPDLAFGQVLPPKAALAFGVWRLLPEVEEAEAWAAEAAAAAEGTPGQGSTPSARPAPIDLSTFVFLEVEVLELGSLPILDPEQEEWLRLNPI